MRTAEELPTDEKARLSRVVDLLGVMLSRHQRERPFLIVTDMETERFVQFAGSREEELLVDCPRLEYQRRFPGVRKGADLETVAVNALDLLERQIRRAPGKVVRWMVDLQWADLREDMN
jgi:hypothetical protein